MPSVLHGTAADLGLTEPPASEIDGVKSALHGTIPFRARHFFPRFLAGLGRRERPGR